VANIIFARSPIGVAEGFCQFATRNTFNPSLRNKRLMTLAHLFLIHRYNAASAHYVSPDRRQPAADVAKMEGAGIFTSVKDEVGDVIVADINQTRVSDLLNPNLVALRQLVARGGRD